MAKNLYEVFPHIVGKEITLRKIVPADLEDLFEIYSNEKLFLHSPNMLKKNIETVENMIGHFERDFHKGKEVFLGICRTEEPGRLLGVAEMFDYAKDLDMVTIGYRLNDKYWGSGFATNTVKEMVNYLFSEVGLNRIQAYVMPENVKSLNVLERNEFIKEGLIRQGCFWKGHGVVDLVLFSLLASDWKGK